MGWIWQELGIDQTGDRKAVQRAYAAKLKAVKGDAEAFKRLRAAYEAATNQIQRAEWQAQEAAQQAAAEQDGAPQDDAAANDPPTDQDVQATEPAAPKPEPAVPAADDPATIAWKAYEAALAAKDVHAAMAVFDRALAQGLVPLGMRDVLVERALAVALEDNTLSAEAYLALLKRTGWGPSAGRIYYWSPTYQKIIARAEAEDWYLHLKALAEAPRRKISNLHNPDSPARWEEPDDRGPVKNARLLVRGVKPFLTLSEERRQHLNQLMAEYRHHLPWIEARIPQTRIAALTRWLTIAEWSGRVLTGAIFVTILLVGLAAIASGTHFAAFGIIILVRMIWAFGQARGWWPWRR